MNTLELTPSPRRGNDNESVPAIVDVIVENGSHLTEARNELSEIHLQMQRAIVLMAASFYRARGSFQFFSATKVDFFANPDSIADADVPAALKSFRALRQSVLVRAAFGVHNFLDRFRKLKEHSFRMVLWFRAMRSVVYPQWRYAGYGRWIELETPKRQMRLAQIQQNWKSLTTPRFLVLLQGAPAERAKIRDSVLAASKNLSVDVVDLESAATWKTEYSKYDIVVRLNSALLAEDALWWMIDSRASSNWSVYYADADVISIFGKRKSPRFHADYSLDYFVSAHPTSSLVAVAGSNIDSKLTGQSLDRVIFQKINEQAKVYHQQLILSHAIKDRTRNDEIFYEAAQGHLKSFDLKLKSRNWGFEVEPSEPVRWPKVSMMVPTKDGLHLLKPLMGGLLHRTDYPNFDILIINNNSSKPETFEYFKELQTAYPGKVRVVEFPQPYNFSAINNFGMKQVDGDLLALLNNDVEVLHADWLKQMVRQALRPDVGAVGAKLYFADGSIQHAGVVLGIGQVAGHIHGFDSKRSKGYLNRLLFAHEFSSLTCACFVLRRDVFVNSGYFSDDLAVAYNDVDFCLKIKEAGYRNIWTPHAELIHKESSTRPPDRRPEQVKRYRMEVDIMRGRWLRYIENDPAYNRQLSREKSDFRLNWAFDHL